jgi:hypothetical protein
MSDQTTREDRDDHAVLIHITEQTGLTFSTEKRKRPIVGVERIE